MLDRLFTLRLADLGIQASYTEIVAVVISLAIIAYFVGYLRGNYERPQGEP